MDKGKTQKIWVLVPAYNERRQIASLLRALNKKKVYILVVDDGSGDETYKIAKNYADIVIRNERNLGKGGAIRRGIAYLIDNWDFDYLITMDADNQHSPDELDLFLEQAYQQEAVVIGNRMYNPASMPWLRLVTNKLMSWVISYMVHQKIPDSQCGFRLIRRDVLEKVETESKKFEVDSEFIIKAARYGFSIKSIPIKTIYFKNHSSRIKPFSDSLRFIKFVLRI